MFSDVKDTPPCQSQVIIHEDGIPFWDELAELDKVRLKLKKYNLEKLYDQTLEKIRKREWTSLRLENLVGSNPIVHSVRMNYCHRLLLTTLVQTLPPPQKPKKYGLSLEIVREHKHKKARFLLPGILKNFLANNQIKWQNVVVKEESPALFLPLKRKKYKLATFYNKDFLVLNPDQELVLDEEIDASVIRGGPGSGKSLLSLMLLAKKRERNAMLNERRPVLYLAHSNDLLIRMKENGSLICEAEEDLPEVHYLTYKEWAMQLDELVGKTILDSKKQYRTWYSSFVDKQKQHAKATQRELELTDSLFGDSDKVYEEFCIISGYAEDKELGKQRYLKLGQRQSLYVKEVRPALWEAYDSFLQSWPTNAVCLEFMPLALPKDYSFIVTDESQLLTSQQWRALLSASSGHIAFFLDTNQSCEKRLSSWCSLHALLDNFKVQFAKYNLSKVHRCSKLNVDLLNTILNIKCYLTGGIGDEDEQFSLSAAEEVEKGHVNWFNQKTFTPEVIEYLNAEAQSVDFAIICEEEQKAAVRVDFPLATILSPLESQGLEFKKTLLINPLKGKKYFEINDALPEESTFHLPRENPVYRAPAGREESKFRGVLQEFLIICSRSTESLHIFQLNEHKLRKLLAPLHRIGIQASLDDLVLQGKSIASSPEEWFARAKKFYDKKYIEQAQFILATHLDLDKQAIAETLANWERESQLLNKPPIALLQEELAAETSTTLGSSKLEFKPELNQASHHPEKESPSRQIVEETSPEDNSLEVQLEFEFEQEMLRQFLKMDDDDYIESDLCDELQHHPEKEPPSTSVIVEEVSLDNYCSLEEELTREFSQEIGSQLTAETMDELAFANYMTRLKIANSVVEIANVWCNIFQNAPLVVKHFTVRIDERENFLDCVIMEEKIAEGLHQFFLFNTWVIGLLPLSGILKMITHGLQNEKSYLAIQGLLTTILSYRPSLMTERENGCPIILYQLSLSGHGCEVLVNANNDLAVQSIYISNCAKLSRLYDGLQVSDFFTSPNQDSAPIVINLCQHRPYGLMFFSYVMTEMNIGEWKKCNLQSVFLGSIPSLFAQFFLQDSGLTIANRLIIDAQLPLPIKFLREIIPKEGDKRIEMVHALQTNRYTPCFKERLDNSPLLHYLVDENRFSLFRFLLNPETHFLQQLAQDDLFKPYGGISLFSRLMSQKNWRDILLAIFASRLELINGVKANHLMESILLPSNGASGERLPNQCCLEIMIDTPAFDFVIKEIFKESNVKKYEAIFNNFSIDKLVSTTTDNKKLFNKILENPYLASLFTQCTIAKGLFKINPETKKPYIYWTLVFCPLAQLKTIMTCPHLTQKEFIWISSAIEERVDSAEVWSAVKRQWPKFVYLQEPESSSKRHSSKKLGCSQGPFFAKPELSDKGNMKSDSVKKSKKARHSQGPFFANKSELNGKSNMKSDSPAPH